MRFISRHIRSYTVLRPLYLKFVMIFLGPLTIILLLDLYAAFDTEDHASLLYRLSCRFGMKGNVLSWLKSYLPNRKQFVKVKEGKFTSRDLLCGVLQGSVLGTILYLLYTSLLGAIGIITCFFSFLC